MPLCLNAAAVTVTRVLPTVLPSSRCTLLALESRSFSFLSSMKTCDHRASADTPKTRPPSFSVFVVIKVPPSTFLYSICICLHAFISTRTFFSSPRHFVIFHPHAPFSDLIWFLKVFFSLQRREGFLVWLGLVFYADDGMWCK